MASTDLLNIELLLEDYLEQIRQSTSNSKIEVDTSELTEVLNRLPLYPSPEQIAQAVAKVVTIPQPIDTTPTLKEVLEAIVSLKKTMRDVAGRNLGGGGSVRIRDDQEFAVSNFPSSTEVSNFPATQAVSGTVTVSGSDLSDIKRGLTDYETRLDYSTRLDDQPIYVGRAPANTATTATTWTIEKLTYDANGRPTRTQVFSAASWDNRGSL